MTAVNWLILYLNMSSTQATSPNEEVQAHFLAWYKYESADSGKSGI